MPGSGGIPIAKPGSGGMPDGGGGIAPGGPTGGRHAPLLGGGPGPPSGGVQAPGALEGGGPGRGPPPGQNPGGPGGGPPGGGPMPHGATGGFQGMSGGCHAIPSAGSLSRRFRSRSSSWPLPRRSPSRLSCSSRSQMASWISARRLASTSRSRAKALSSPSAIKCTRCESLLWSVCPRSSPRRCSQLAPHSSCILRMASPREPTMRAMTLSG